MQKGGEKKEKEGGRSKSSRGREKGVVKGRGRKKGKQGMCEGREWWEVEGRREREGSGGRWKGGRRKGLVGGGREGEEE